MTHAPATDARAGDDPLSTDSETEHGACHFWYKIHLIRLAWRSGCPRRTRYRVFAHESCKN